MTPNDDDLLLECRGLSRHYDGAVALSNFSYQFPSAGIVALVGPNGAGKTTLLNLINGFIKPDHGTCSYGGLDLTKLPPDEIARRGIGRTFQDVRLVNSLSVSENVMLCFKEQQGEVFWRAMMGTHVQVEQRRNRERVVSLLTEFGLQREAARSPEVLSYGQRKLLALICCMALDPHVLLLDEPTAGVDLHNAEKIVSALIKLRAEGKLLVVIEHNYEIVTSVADIVLVLEAGRLSAVTSPQALLRSR